jgi:hypothetical protein
MILSRAAISVSPWQSDRTIMRRHKYIVGMRIQGRARDIALQQSLSERVRGKAHEYNCYCAAPNPGGG